MATLNLISWSSDWYLEFNFMYFPYLFEMISRTPISTLGTQYGFSSLHFLVTRTPISWLEGPYHLAVSPLSLLIGGVDYLSSTTS